MNNSLYLFSRILKMNCFHLRRLYVLLTQLWCALHVQRTFTMSSVSCAAFWKTESQCCRYFSYRPSVWVSSCSRDVSPSSTFCRLTRKSVLTGPHSMRLTLQERSIESIASMYNAAIKMYTANILITRLAKRSTLQYSLDIEVLQEDGQTLTCSLYCEFTGTVHLIKRETCGRWLSTKMEEVILAISCMAAGLNMLTSNHYRNCTRGTRMTSSDSFARLTVKPSGAAGDQDPALTLSLHFRKEGLDGLDGAEEVDLQNLPHRVQGLQLQWAHQTHTSIAHCK